LKDGEVEFKFYAQSMVFRRTLSLLTPTGAMITQSATSENASWSDLLDLSELVVQADLNPRSPDSPN